MKRYKNFFLSIGGLIFVLLSTWSMHSSIQSYGVYAQENIYRQPFDYAPLVDVEIAGKHYNFMLDSGTSVVMLDARLARQITVPMDTTGLVAKSAYRQFTQITGSRGGVDPARVDFVRPVDLKMGPFSLGGQDVWIAADLKALSESVGVEVSGLLGVDTFRQFSWQVFNDSKVMEFSRGPIEAAAFDECLSYSDEFGYHPALTLGVGKYKVFMPFDTGAASSYIGKDMADRLRSEPGLLQTRSSKELVVTLGGTSEVTRHVLNSVTLDGQPLGALEVSETSDTYGLGLDVLARFSRYAFIPARRMFCYSGRSPIDPLPPVYRDVRVKAVEGQLVIDYNASEQLRGLGLNNGDVIAQINDHVYPGSQIHRVRDLLNNTPAGKLNMQILRDGQVLEIRL